MTYIRCHFRSCWIVALLCLALAPVSAGASSPAPRQGSPVQASLPAPSGLASLRRAPPAPDPAQKAARDAELERMAARLQVPHALLAEGQRGLEMLYLRRYGEARELFRSLSERYPDSPVGPFGLVLLAQAQMSENLDFKQDSAYQMAYRETVARADRALRRGEAPAWNHFMRGTALGVNGIYLYRKDKLLSAFQDGWSALGDLQKARELEPEFADPVLGLGIYDYWRSDLTRRYKYLGFFPDKRQQGLEEMFMARDKGIFSPTLTRLALAFTYLQGHNMDMALATSQELYAAYPDNIINLQLLGQLYSRKRRTDLARQCYRRVLEIDPQAVQVYYYLGSLELRRKGDLKLARTYLTRFVNSEPDNSYEVPARVRLGDACWLLGDSSSAEQQWQLAARQDPGYWLVKKRLAGERPGGRPGRRATTDATVKGKVAERPASTPASKPQR